MTPVRTVSHTPDIEQKGEVKSRYYVVQELISEDTYRISIIYDDVLGTKNMELFGMLDDGSFCLMQTALESIQNSSEIIS